MCGRYTVVSKLKKIEKTFEVSASEVEDRFNPNVNVCPGEQALVISSDAPDKLQLYTFGFTPFWAKKRMYVINARSEGNHNQDNDPRYTGAKGIISKPMFRKAIRSQRCLVIADAFIEGTVKERLSKPFLVYRSDTERPLALAGIWDEWIDKESGEVYRSFAILTTSANALLQKIPHHRAPLVLEEEQEKNWLDVDLPLQDITAMMHPFDSTGFNAYPISPEVKSAKNKSPDLLKPKGDPLVKEHDYVFYQHLKLEGMGQTSARQRRAGEQLDLFDQ